MKIDLFALLERFTNLEKEVKNLKSIVDIYENQFPDRYKKAVVKPGENPFFTLAEKPLPSLPSVFKDGRNFCEIAMPKNPEVYREALERMKSYASKHEMLKQKAEKKDKQTQETIKQPTSEESPAVSE